MLSSEDRVSVNDGKPILELLNGPTENKYSHGYISINLLLYEYHKSFPQPHFHLLFPFQHPLFPFSVFNLVFPVDSVVF